MTNVNCIRCGAVNLIADEVCKECGTELRAPGYTQPLPATEPEDEGVPYPAQSAIPPFDGAGDGVVPTFNLFKNNAWLITKIVFVIVAPFEIFKTLSFKNIQRGDWQLIAGTFVLQILCSILVAPALFYALTKVTETGVAPGINESYRWALGKLPKLLMAAILSWVIVALGTLACVIPGIILGVAFVPVYGIAVFEQGSAIDALKRSWEITKGHRWSIFAACFVIGLIIFAFNIPATVIAGVLTFNQVNFWPLEAAVAIYTDIVAEMTTVLSLVIYVGILRTLERGHSVLK
jgi:hypothetical protein